MQTAIKSTRAFRIWDSRGRPTVEVEVTLQSGVVGRGIAPAGASRGANEAVDLRDGGAQQGGFGIGKAMNNVNGDIDAALRSRDACDQEACDNILLALDPTATKERLGGNAVVATSMAVLDAAAKHNHLPIWKHLCGDARVRMPLPQIQIFGGGAHARPAHRYPGLPDRAAGGTLF